MDRSERSGSSKTDTAPDWDILPFEIAGQAGNDILNDGGLLNQSPSCTLAVTFPRSAES